MKLLTILIMTVALMAGVAYAGNYEVARKTGEYNVLVSMDKNPPSVGDNNVTITIKDAAGKYVTDAKVKMEYSMPAMPPMPAMNYKTDALLSGETFAAKMNLSMSGVWYITVKISRGGKISAVKFNVEAP